MIRGIAELCGPPRRLRAPRALAWAGGVLVAVAGVGCTATAHVDPPQLEGYRTLLVGRAGASSLELVELPAAALRVELEAAAVDGVYGHLLAYRESIEALDLPVSGGRVTLAADGEPMPAPAQAWALGEDLAWRGDDVGRWAARRVSADPCLEPSIQSIALARGSARFMVPWSDDAVLVALRGDDDGVVRLFRVTPTDAERLDVDLRALQDGEQLGVAVDEAGHLWVARTSTRTATSTQTETQLRLVEVDRTLTAARVVDVSAGEPTSTASLVAGLAVGRPGGRPEAFVTMAPSDRSVPPRAVRWREGETRTTSLPWPGGADFVPCEGVGVYRVFTRHDGPDAASFLLRQGVINRWSGGVMTRERIDEDICGGAILDDRLEEGALAILQPERPPELPPRAARVFRRTGEDWGLLGEFLLFNGHDLVTWRGRELATGDGGDLFELQPYRADLVVCPPIRALPANDRMRHLVRVGRRLAAFGPATSGDLVRVFWLDAP